MKYLYGPVKSRRIGFSLGVSLTPFKTCTFDCIYCQLGKTTDLTTQRKEYIKINDIVDELKFWFLNNKEEAASLQFVTISGSGEPTLNSGIANLIKQIRGITTHQICLITNSSLLSNPAVRQEILGADLIVPSLDAVTPKLFTKIDFPHKDLKINDIVNGLIALRREFRGKLWLEVMLVKGVNDDLRHIKKLKEIIERINPDKIQLNSPVRAPLKNNILTVDKSKLNKIKALLGDRAEII
ncbi:MAG: radical SAM protein [Candidatus Omnitrophica bacterium]|nr:radical SAM protein [Candidatus Omnitrophota bacterium]